MVRQENLWQCKLSARIEIVLNYTTTSLLTPLYGSMIHTLQNISDFVFIHSVNSHGKKARGLGCSVFIQH